MNHPWLTILLSGLCLMAGCNRQRATPVPEALHAPTILDLPFAVSVQGRSIDMVQSGMEGPVTLIIGGIHGNEPTSAYVADQLAELLRSSRPAGMRGSVVIIPRANPDGCAAGRRANARGVDINRNFPASNWKPSRSTGATPRSEPETQALVRVIDELKPVRIISIHSIGGGRECNNFDGPAEALAASMSRHNGYPVTPTMGYSTPGSLGTWAGIDRQIPIITLELPRQLPGEQAWAANREALLAAITIDGGGTVE